MGLGDEVFSVLLYKGVTVTKADGTIVKLLLRADPKRTLLFLLLIPLALFAQSDRPSERGDRWSRVFAESAPAETQLAARDAWAKPRAEAAIGMLRFGQGDSAWQILAHSSDPSARSYFIRDLGTSGVSAKLIARRLHAESDTSVRRALILALGRFGPDQIPATIQRNLVGQFLRWYRDDPDPGIHSAIDWLLSEGRIGLLARTLDWGQRAALSAIDQALVGKQPGDRSWFLTREAHTMAILRGPMEFVMGHPPTSRDGTRVPTRILIVFEFLAPLQSRPRRSPSVSFSASSTQIRPSKGLRKHHPSEIRPGAASL
jgi:hypothetical protein